MLKSTLGRALIGLAGMVLVVGGNFLLVTVLEQSVGWLPVPVCVGGFLLGILVPLPRRRHRE